MTETVYTIRGNLGALRSSTTLTNRSTDVAPGFCTRPEGQRISILELWIAKSGKLPTDVALMIDHANAQATIDVVHRRTKTKGKNMKVGEYVHNYVAIFGVMLA